MANGNNITLVGNLTRDPELRYTASGRSSTTLGLAVSRRYQDRNGEWQEESGFFNVVCWGDLAENVQSIKKGTRVIVTGRLQWRQWETDNNEKRTVIEVVADEVGPSLRWATVEVHRTERRGPDGGGGGTGGGGGGAPAREPVGAPARQNYDDFGEEPF